MLENTLIVKTFQQQSAKLSYKSMARLLRERGGVLRNYVSRYEYVAGSVT